MLKDKIPNYGVHGGLQKKRSKRLKCLYLVLFKYLGLSNIRVVKQGDLGLSVAS